MTPLKRTLFPLVFGLCISSTALAYRTAAELPSIASSSPVRWSGQLFTYVLFNQAPPGVPFSDYEQGVEAALQIWAAPACTSFAVSYFGPVGAEAQSGDGLNTIEFVQNGWAARGFDPTAPGQTDALYGKDSNGQWVIKEADIYINGESNSWVLAGDATSTGWSVRSALIHESGHAAGLEHPCDIIALGSVPACSSSTVFDGVAMNPVYNPTLSSLASDDEAGICAVYPKGLCGSVICATTETCTSTGCRLTCGKSTCSSGQLCESGKCVSPASDASVSGAGAAGWPCADGAECAAGFACVDMICQGVLASVGDPCTTSATCQNSVCSSQGYCSTSCQQNSDCSAVNATCEPAQAGTGACVSGQSTLGAACDSANDCAGGECLVEGSATPVCTRLCDSTAACPAGWSCVQVDGKNVCGKARSTEEGGCVCRQSRTYGHARTSSFVSILVILGLLLRRNRFQYSRRTSCGCRPSSRAAHE